MSYKSLHARWFQLYTDTDGLGIVSVVQVWIEWIFTKIHTWLLVVEAGSDVPYVYVSYFIWFRLQRSTFRVQSRYGWSSFTADVHVSSILLYSLKQRNFAYAFISAGFHFQEFSSVKYKTNKQNFYSL